MAQADPLFTFSRFFVHRLQAGRLQLTDVVPDKKAGVFPISKSVRSIEDQRRRLTSIDSAHNPFKLPADRIRKLAKSSPSRSRFARFMTALIQTMDFKQVLETGTSVGLTTAYLATANRTHVTSIERDATLLEIALDTCKKYENITLVHGPVSDHFQTIVQQKVPELVFLDADHRSEVILSQIKYLLDQGTPPQLIIVHDIYWSRDMYRGWMKARALPGIQYAIDLFEAGLLLTSQSRKSQLLKRYL